ncbi:MAG: selenium cofactor biosynthesis protein YqeC [Anaerolineales bacterium]
MKLVNALRADAKIRLAISGAGGKTTALFQLARQLTPPVLVSASTHLSLAQVLNSDYHVFWSGDRNIDFNHLTGVSLIMGEPISDDRVNGLSLQKLEQLRLFADQMGYPLLIEADGSRMRPLKAPADHEPPIPEWVNTSLVVAGLSGVGRPLSEKTVHRPEVFSDLSGVSIGKPITIDGILKVLCDARGGLKNIPPQAKRVALLNQADNHELRSLAQEIVPGLQQFYHAVLISSLGTSGEVFSVHEKTAAIILAAGASTRLGRPKALLEWQGKPLIQIIASVAIRAGLSPVIVVIGAVREPILEALKGLSVEFVINENWELGQSSSIKAGLAALPPYTGSAVFLLADQPRITIDLLLTLVRTHATTLDPIMAPFVGGRRSNPVLFDAITFCDLERLEGDIGGRAIFEKYPVTPIYWNDPRLLLDIDTEEDYKKLTEDAV